MAEETKEKQEKKKSTYKFGESELDLNTYIRTLGHNLNSYLNTKTDWTDEQRTEFTTAYDKYIAGLKEQRDSGVERFSSTDYGGILDSQGKLNNTDDDGIDPVGSEYYYNDNGERITTDDYNLLSDKKKKKYKTFSANREVASYFKTIAEAVKSETDKKTKETNTNDMFNITKHGYIPYHSSRYNPTGGTWDGQSILDLDPYDEATGKRGTSQRTARLASDLDQYLKEMDSNLDFSKTRWKTREGYENFIRGTIGKINDGLTSQDYLDLAEAGLTREFLEPYITTEKSLMSKAQRDAADAKAKAEADAKTREEQNKAYQEMMAERLRIYDTNKGTWHEDNPYYLGTLSYWDPTTNTFDTTGWDSSWQGDNRYYDAAGKFLTDKYLDDYLTGNDTFTKEGRRALSAIMKYANYEVISDGPYKGAYYIPQINDSVTNTALVYNPTTGTLQKVFIGDIPSQANRIKSKWMEEKGITHRTDRYNLFKEGGSIEMKQLGGGISVGDRMEEDRQKQLKERADAAGVSVEKQKAGERKTNGIFGSSDAKDPGNLNADWKGTDTARIASSVADIISMIAAFGGPVGTAVSAGLGIGSSLTTFGADVVEDGLDWGDIGNLGVNVGFDLLGVIPGGGAASKGVKIAKTLGKYASRAMAVIAATQGLANSGNIIKSINKMTTDPKNLTVNDWRNIAQGFGLLTGGIAAGTRKYKKAVVEADMKAKANGAVAVEIVDKSGKNKKIIAFTGDDAKAIKQAQESGDLKALREATVDKYEQFKDWDLSTTGNVGFRSARGTDGWQLPWGAKEGRARVFDMYGDGHGNLFTKGGNWSADVKTGSPINPATELTTATVGAALKDNRTKALDELKLISETWGKRKTNLEKKIKDTNDAFTAEIKTKKDALDAANAAATPDPAVITSAQNAYDDAIARQLDWQTRRARIQSYIDDFNSGKVYDNWKSKYLQGTADDAKLVISDPRYTRKEELVFKDILKNLGINPHNFKYEKGGRIKSLARFLKSGNELLITNPIVDDQKKKSIVEKPTDYKFSWEMDPNLKFGLPRAMYADFMNRRMTDLMKESPTLQNPFEYQRTVQSDLNSEMQGHKSAATLANMASKPMTSDASLQVATQLEAANKGQEFINKGVEASNTAYRQSAELAWQQEKENAKNRNAIASINNTAMAAVDANNRKHEAAYLSKKATIWDTLAKQFEYDAKTEQLEKKAEQKALVNSDIRKQVLDEVLSENGAFKYGLSPSHVAVLQELNSGKTISTLSTDEEKKLAIEANKIIEELITSRYAKWRGLRRYYEGTPKINQTTTYTPIVIPGEKKGGKIEVAGIKARTADAERFQKLIIESIKRNEKSLDRLSKSMVNYVKDIMK